ncbi:MAG TPA: MFS transporter [Nocardioides sp.]|nr:MFS transporter [Nocardioides sp.]
MSEQATAVMRTSRTVLPGVAMIAVSFGLARYGYGLLLPEMRAEFGMGADAAGLISSGAYLSYLVANAAVVWVTARHGARVAIGLAAGLAAVGMAVISVAGSVPVLAVGVITAGAAAGLAYPPYADLVDRQVAEPRRDAAWSAISSGTGWGVAVAGPIAVVAGDEWRLAWAGFVVLAVAAGVLAVRLAPAHEQRRLTRPQLSWTWFFCPRSRPLLLSAVIVGVTSSVWWAFGVDAMRAGGVDATTARVVYAACGVASVLASFSGAAYDRLGLRTGYLVTCGLLAGSLAVFGLATEQVSAALLGAVAFGVFYCAIIAAQGIWSSRVFPDHPAAGLAAVNTALTVGTLLGPTLAGVALEELGYGRTLVGAALLTVLALPFCPPRPEKAEELAAHVCTAAPARD